MQKLIKSRLVLVMIEGGLLSLVITNGMRKIHTKNEDEFNAFARKAAKKLKANKNGAKVLALSGDLGVGKTTFTKALLKELGLKKIVQSPTFLIIKKYSLKGEFKAAYHIDTYRLEESEEILRLGLEKILEKKKNLVIIEWADKIKEFLPENVTWINFSHYDKGRQIEIKNDTN